MPEGYRVESIPKAEAFALPENFGLFKYNISHNESTIQLVIETRINSPIIPSFHYDTLKAYFNKLIEKENEQIVLTKK